MKPASPPPRRRAARQSRPLSIRETSFEDYRQIAALHARHGLAERSRENWAKQWSANPAYAGQPIGWVIETANGEIVGSVANFASVYCFRGRTLRAAVAGDWGVDPEYRGYSLQLMARLTDQEDADITLTTTASPKAETMLQAFRWRRAPVGAWDKVAFWVADHHGFANAALHFASVPLASAVSYPAGSALSVHGWFNEVRFRKLLASAAVEPCSAFDDRFDTFWEELKLQNPGLLLGVRTREALAWHFRNGRPGENYWILTSSSGTRLTAYAVFDYKANARSGLTRARIIDFQALQGHEYMLHSFLAWMLRECRRLGIHLLENLGCWLMRPGLPRVARPFVRTLSSWSFLYTVKNPDLAMALDDPAAWVPSSFDGDVAT